MDYASCVTVDLAQVFASSGNSQLSVMEVDWFQISKCRVVVPNECGAGITGMVDKPDASDAPSKLLSI